MKKRTKYILLGTLSVVAIALLTTGLLLYINSENRIIEARVVSVIDGDTIIIENGESVRLIGVDAPERDEEYYEEAKDWLKNRVLGRIVKLEKDKENRDQYGRLLRYVWSWNSLVNLELVRAGYATSYPYPPNIRYVQALDEAEEYAKNANLGLWNTSGSDYILPKNLIPDFSTSTPSFQSSGIYVGSVNSNKYHYPYCEWANKISPSNEIWFSSSIDARSKGYVPCKVCNPP